MFDLSKFDNSFYNPGNIFIKSLWYLVSILFFESKIPYPNMIKIIMLKLFRCKIGRNVLIKPNVKIKYPWQLTIGDNSWIGENVWIDNVSEITIKSNVCISQGVMFESGNHNFKKQTFDLMLQPIVVEENVWLGCRCTVLPGTIVKSGSIYFGGRNINKNTKPDYNLF